MLSAVVEYSIAYCIDVKLDELYFLFLFYGDRVGTYFHNQGVKSVPDAIRMNMAQIVNVLVFFLCVCF